MREAAPLSGDMALLAQLLSSPAPAPPAPAGEPEPNGSSSGRLQDENTAPPNGMPILASHDLKV